MTRQADFAGRVALVTGAGSGIGAATAMTLAARGAAVAVVDRDAAKAAEVAVSIRSEGGHAIEIIADVSVPSEVSRAVRGTLSAFRRLDILINNAGTSSLGSVGTTPYEEWLRVLGVNLTGPFLCSKEAIPHLVKANPGVIVNNCSIDALSGDPLMAAYSASKGGLLQLTRQMAMDYAGLIRVNAVSPGAVDTPLQRAGLADNDDAVAQHAEWLRLYVPLEREATAEEVARVICFLASDESSYMTGANVAVDGGLLAGRHYDMRRQRSEDARR